ncbi:Proteasome assembly chaperone 2 [Polyrhizophydium stewartii]|uniref:Proteasome assembly chaperone 2 n=1 Tax=Polyrhizophydium stewartii TaxID=2732419 RepID=A0ABR4N2W7_9FUNG
MVQFIGDEAQTLGGTTLLLPGPNGLGFVGQLALDLVIATLKLKRIGFLDSADVEAVVGVDSYGAWDPPAVHTAMEVFQGRVGDGPGAETITVLQIRSRVEKGRGVAFAGALAAWIAASGFSRVLLATAFDGTRRSDAQLNSSPLRFVQTGPANAGAFPRIAELGWREMEPAEGLYTDSPSRIPPGGGLTRFLQDALTKRETPLTVLGWFAIEGDNMQDVCDLAAAIDALLQLRPKDEPWSQPRSWEHLYGPLRFTRDLF